MLFSYASIAPRLYRATAEMRSLVHSENVPELAIGNEQEQAYNLYFQGIMLW